MLEKEVDVKQMQEKAREIRKDILTMLHLSASGHTGGSLSLVEILVSLYYDVANIDPKNPKSEDRDRIILSKGHGAPVLYTVLADKGYFDKEDLKTLRKIDSHLQGHPDMHKTPGVDMCTGSLGQGVSVAVGMALAEKHKRTNHKVYAILGDGELQEGIVWEACMSAAHYKLDNLCIIIDNNGLQIDGSNKEVMDLLDIGAKLSAFGLEVITVDGHDFTQILSALKKETNGKPKAILAKTVKGKGISFMEDNYTWHGKAPNKDELEKAMKELEA